ncbi:MAG: BON domain-containing protein [bacterium]
MAEEITKGIKGIKRLENDINIEYTEYRTDYEITNEIKRKLESSVWIDDALIEVKTKNGHVTLTGAVGSAIEKARTYSAAWISGVKSVNNDKLKVKWWAHDEMRRDTKYALKSDQEIKEAVKDAFLWDPRVFSFNLTVEVDNGVVTLKGTVDNYEAKRAAENDVENKIRVDYE